MSAEVTAQLKIDTAEYLRKLKAADASMDGTARKAKVSWQGISEAAKHTGKVIATAISGTAVAAVAALSYSLQGALREGVALNASFESSRTTMQAFVKDMGKTNEMVAALNAEARKFGFDPNDMNQAGRMLVSYAKGSMQEMMKMVKIAEILSALNPAEGLAGAAFSLREAISGDFVSIQDRFNLPRSMINQMKKEGKEGLDIVEAVLKQIGAGPELVEGLSKSFTGLQNNVMGTFTEIKRVLAEPVFAVLKAGLAEFAGELRGKTGSDLMTWARELGTSLGQNAKMMVDNLKQVDWHNMLNTVQQIAQALGSAAELSTRVFGGMSDLSTAVQEKGGQFGKAFTKASFWLPEDVKKRNIAEIDADLAKIYQADSAHQARLRSREVSAGDVMENYARAHGITPQQARQRLGTRVNVVLSERNPMHTVMAT